MACLAPARRPVARTTCIVSQLSAPWRWTLRHRAGTLSCSAY